MPLTGAERAKRFGQKLKEDPEKYNAYKKKLIPLNIKAVPGTMKLHQIVSKQKHVINYRLVSCFCGNKRGLCNCHCPETHLLVPVEANRDDESIFVTANVMEATSSNNIIHENNTHNTVKIDNAAMTSGTENILDDDSLLPLITAGSDDLILSESFLKDINFEIDGDILLEQSSGLNHSPSIVTARNASMEETKKENFHGCNPSPGVAANVSVIDLTSTQNVVPQNAQQFPYPRKRVRILIPGDAGLPTKKSRDKTISDKENKRKIKVLLPSTKRNICCFVCYLCKRESLSLKDMVKCMVCKNWLCVICSGTDSFDYICSKCLTSD